MATCFLRLTRSQDDSAFVSSVVGWSGDGDSYPEHPPEAGGLTMANPSEKRHNVSIIHGTTDKKVVARALQVGWALLNTFTSGLDSADGRETTHYVLKWEGDTLPVTVDGM